MLPRDFRAPLGYFVDTSLLLLFVVGSVGRNLIAKHRRLQEYTAEDFETLANLLRRVDQICVTPNTLTEASNLLSQHGEPERSLILENLRVLIEESREIVVQSVEASSNSAFVGLGLTDAALLEAISEEIPLVTVDWSLFNAALNKGIYNCVNFNHHRRL